MEDFRSNLRYLMRYKYHSWSLSSYSHSSISYDSDWISGHKCCKSITTHGEQVKLNIIAKMVDKKVPENSKTMARPVFPDEKIGVSGEMSVETFNLDQWVSVFLRVDDPVTLLLSTNCALCIKTLTGAFTHRQRQGVKIKIKEGHKGQALCQMMPYSLSVINWWAVVWMRTQQSITAGCSSATPVF